jgi:hypothetical protein
LSSWFAPAPTVRRTRSGIRDGRCVFPVTTLSGGSGRRSTGAPWSHRAGAGGRRANSPQPAAKGRR